jgi:hypothetical protein
MIATGNRESSRHRHTDSSQGGNEGAGSSFPGDDKEVFNIMAKSVNTTTSEVSNLLVRFQFQD